MELLKTDPFWKPTQWRRRSIWYNWTELPDVGSLLISTCDTLANLIRLSSLQMMHRRTNKTSLFGSGRTWGYTRQWTIILVIYQMSDFGRDNRFIAYHLSRWCIEGPTKHLYLEVVVYGVIQGSEL